MTFYDERYCEIGRKIADKVNKKYNLELTAKDILAIVVIGIFEYGLSLLREGKPFVLYGIGRFKMKDYRSSKKTYQEFKKEKVDKRKKEEKELNLDENLLMTETNSNFALLNNLKVSTNKNYNYEKARSNRE